MLNCGIIGFGGLGKVHFGNVTKMDGVKLCAVCDFEDTAFTSKTEINLGSGAALDLSAYNLYNDYKDMLTRENLDFVIIAVPTFLHAEISIYALNAGIHTFCEKPIALTVEQGQEMIDASKCANRLLMIGQCLRYWPEYVKLKEYIDGGTYGKVIRAEFRRRSMVTKWGWQNWFMDVSKSGGAVVDLHVHDVDMISWLFGKPGAVTSSATHYVTEFDSIFTSYQYPDKTVTAIGDWGFPDKYPFAMEFEVRFEEASVSMNENGFVVWTNDETLKPKLPCVSAFFNEVADFVRCINAGEKVEKNPPESSLLSLKIALTEKESALKGEKVNVQ